MAAPAPGQLLSAFLEAAGQPEAPLPPLRSRLLQHRPSSGASDGCSLSQTLHTNPTFLMSRPRPQTSLGVWVAIPASQLGSGSLLDKHLAALHLLPQPQLPLPRNL